MRRPSRARWVLLALAGCGRGGFDPMTIDGPPDAPPLPPMICADARSSMMPVGAADLAIAPTMQGFVAAWVDPARGPLEIARLDDSRSIVGDVVALAPGPFTGIAGVVDVGDALSLVTLGASHTTWTVPYSLDAAVEARMETAIASRPPMSSSGSARALFRALDNQIVMSYVTSDGTVRQNATFTASRPVTALAVDDGPGHGHVAWAEGDAGTSSCGAEDVFYDDLMAPRMPGGAAFIEDCFEPRTATGPDPDDSMIVVRRTAMRNIVATYLGRDGRVETTISLAGRAPRVRFDGDAHFWITWIEELPAPMLRIARLSLDGAVVRGDLPGWTPAGDEAFELVRNGTFTYLAVLGSDALDMLTLCP